jgi:thiamine biosynthesis lipoprotein
MPLPTRERPETGAAVPCTYRTKAIGTVAELFVTDGGSLVAASELLEAELARIDRVASRFRDDSELSRLNDAGGAEVQVSADLMEAVRVALSMAEATEGLVDPTVGRAMLAIGYDRDIDEVRAGRDGALPAAHAVPGWRRVALDPGRGTIRLPLGTTLDLGATAKALAADRAAHRVAERLGCGVLVSLGGDVATAGEAPPEGFVVGLADTCTSPRAAETVSIRAGGLASSGTGSRHWRVGHDVVHHIVDPSTGLPAATCWRTVTVTAATCVEANAASTAAMVLGERAVAWLESRRLPARLVDLDGRITRIAGWPVPAGGAEDPGEVVGRGVLEVAT